VPPSLRSGAVDLVSTLLQLEALWATETPFCSGDLLCEVGMCLPEAGLVEDVCVRATWWCSALPLGPALERLVSESR
jgi:hypothetical protein